MEGTSVGIKYKQGKLHIQARVQEIITKKGWWGMILICDGLWQRLNIGQYCKSIESWDIRRGLQLANNKRPRILSEISCIKFAKLLYLSLQGNMIQSIQPLKKLQCPMLHDLDLGLNKIRNLQPLRQLGFCSLQRINLSGNIIIGYQCLSQINQPKLTHIYFQYQQDDPKCQSICVISKIKSLRNSCAWSKNRIKQKKVFQTLSRKNGKFSFLPKYK